MARAVLHIRLSKDPRLAILLDDEKLKKLATDEDLRLAGERQRARIVERTMRGVDVHGHLFAPYSTRVFYWYPAGPNRSTVSRKRAVRRMVKITGGTPTASGLGIRFDGGYAEFKRRIGRGPGVDLTGPRAPHLLQSMIAWASQGVIHIGFWDPEKAKIAQAHNTGARTGRGHKVRLPKREFFGVSREERGLIRADIRVAVRERLRRK